MRLLSNTHALLLALATLITTCPPMVPAFNFCFAAKPDARPNVVLILADDLGYTDLGCYGSRYYRTPHIDRMAAEGMRFTNGYTCGPNCQPTRAAMMSGQYGPRTGVYTVGSIERFPWRTRSLRPADNVAELPTNKITLGQAMQSCGYVTGLFGKWHLGDDADHHPLARGFDESIVSMGKHFHFNTIPRTEYPEDAYLADFLTDKAVDFIHRHRDGPFFLCLHHFAVHSPWEAKTELIQEFRDLPAEGGHHDPVYAAMIAGLDESVGRVLKTLHELNLAENTLVVFTSDNGGVGGYAREGLGGKDITDNAPLRGGKGMLYEGGIRVPYIFWQPGTVPGGKECDVPICSVDLFPTLLDLAGGTPPEAYPLDGTSYAAILKGHGGDALKDRALFWHFPGYLGAGKGTWRTTPVSVVRKGDWKLLQFLENGRVELYDLRNDIGEKENLAEQHPQKTAELLRLLQAWRAEIRAPMPSPHTPEIPDEDSRRPRPVDSRRSTNQAH